jgi:topoisomerase-4 subunit A
VVMSEKGWIRGAKGHDIDPTTLSYKSGDGFKMSVCGRSNQPAVLLDSTGRAYTIPTHNLPSARGQGEPVTGRINPPSGATFEGLMMGSEDQLYLLASDAGYGFVAKLGDLQSKNRAGKAALSPPKGGEVLQPARIESVEGAWVAAVSNEGRMLVFPLADLPQLARGKGNKIIGIPSARVQSREEFVVAVQVLSEKDVLVVSAGKRYLKLKFSELEHYCGERGRRGNKLPRGFQKVERMQIDIS